MPWRPLRLHTPLGEALHRLRSRPLGAGLCFGPVALPLRKQAAAVPSGQTSTEECELLPSVSFFTFSAEGQLLLQNMSLSRLSAFDGSHRCIKHGSLTVECDSLHRITVTYHRIASCFQ